MVVHSTTDEEDKERAEELVVEDKRVLCGFQGVVETGSVWSRGASRQLLMCPNVSQCKCDQKNG